MIEDSNAEQIITLQDNAGNFAELIAYYDIDGTVVLHINATDGVVASTIALALVNFATALVTDNETGRYLDYAKARLLDACIELMAIEQNEQPVNQDDCPF